MVASTVPWLVKRKLLLFGPLVPAVAAQDMRLLSSGLGACFEVQLLEVARVADAVSYVSM